VVAVSRREGPLAVDPGNHFGAGRGKSPAAEGARQKLSLIHFHREARYRPVFGFLQPNSLTVSSLPGQALAAIGKDMQRSCRQTGYRQEAFRNQSKDLNGNDFQEQEVQQADELFPLSLLPPQNDHCFSVPAVFAGNCFQYPLSVSFGQRRDGLR
jgi:hypothetical protein